MGGGLAGLAAAAALADAGCTVDVYEAKPFFGGRATSYRVDGEVIDNCQHILLRCCVNLLDFYQRLGVEQHIEFHRRFFFIEPGGRTSILERGLLPAPAHFAGAFARASWLKPGEKIALGRALLALRRERKTRTDLDRITMQEWLEEKRQPPRVIERFWRQVLVSAINEELDRMAAAHGFQVFWLGFLAKSDGYEMGIPRVPLAELYSPAAWARFPGVRLHERSLVESIETGHDRAGRGDPGASQERSLAESMEAGHDPARRGDVGASQERSLVEGMDRGRRRDVGASRERSLAEGMEAGHDPVRRGDVGASQEPSLVESMEAGHDQVGRRDVGASQERSFVEGMETAAGRVTSIRVDGQEIPVEQCVVALPFERLRLLLPDLPVPWDAFEHSPITGIHLWFDRPVTSLPHGTLLDRTIQWFYNKGGGRHLQVVVSASRSLTLMPRQQVIDLALRELAEFLPAVQEAKLTKAHVVKEVRATFSARPGLEAVRPGPVVAGLDNLFLAGDWTRSGWPATMEGAVRSGYRAADALLARQGLHRSYLLPDIA